MYTFGMAGNAEAFDPLVLLLLAIFFDAYLGDMRPLMRFLKHPVVLIGGLVDFLDRKLNRDKRGDMDRAIRGALTVVIVVCITGTIGVGIAWLTRNHTFGWVLELFLLTLLLAGRSLYDHVKAVATALKVGLEPGREAVAQIVGRDPEQLDLHGVCRAAIESCAENLCDGVIAPVFWYVLFGFPGLIIYKAVNTMDSMIGHRNARYRAFGMTAARLDDVLNIIPARLTGLFLVMAALFAPTAHPMGALKAMLRDAGKHRSPNAGWSEAAMAGALDLALAGPRRYANTVVPDAWMGTGTARAKIVDIDKALYLYVVALLINTGWVAALTVVRLSTQ
jgi:adenosylcobinamide-phosphate synthase